MLKYALPVTVNNCTQTHRVMVAFTLFYDVGSMAMCRFSANDLLDDYHRCALNASTGERMHYALAAVALWNPCFLSLCFG